jgi:hypothetical protein
MRFLRNHIPSALLSVVSIILLWQIWTMKGSIAWTGFITFQAENLRLAIRADASVDAVVHSLDFYLTSYRAHVGSIRERMLLQVVNRDKEQVISTAVEFLRKKTDEDLGDDPEQWIAKFSSE